MLRVTFLNILILSLVISFGMSQGLGQQSGRFGKDLPRYDRATEVTIVGTVEEVREYPYSRERMGTHLIVNVGDELLEVHVGPSAFLIEKHFTFAKGDEVLVTGSEQQVEGTYIMIARRIVKDDKLLLLRSSHGIPLWSRTLDQE